MVELAERVLRPVARQAASNGAALIHLEEPWLPYVGIASGDWAPLRDALETLHDQLQATVVLHLYFGDASPHLAELRRLPIDGIGIDLIESDVGALGSGWDKALVAGVVDGRDSRIEPSARVVEIANHLIDTIKPTALYLTSNSELAFLPTEVAERKVQRLGEAARKVKEEFVSV
jgi:methionine synthase II (cobalamin-independent)